MNQKSPEDSVSSQPNRLLRLAMPVPLRHEFDYLPIPGKPLPMPGERVLAPFGKRELTGVLLEAITLDRTPVDSRRLLPVLEYPDDGRPSFPPELLAFCLWAAAYYHHPVGEVLSHALPVALRTGARVEQKADGLLEARGGKDPEVTPGPVVCRPAPYLLNEGQALALESLNAIKDIPGLLHGVTSSGKTEIYLRLIEQQLLRGRQALVLVPEISLTPQTLARFSARFSPPPVTLHSGLSTKQRFKAWLQASRGLTSIVIGTRSAIFTPLPRLGLIVVDEEHDGSYKQQEGFRYSARDLAVYRARSLGIRVLLGSATPSLESLHNAASGRYHYVQLSQRTGSAATPHSRLIDLRMTKTRNGISQKLITLMARHLDRGGQVLAFLSRRGYSPVIMCSHCSWVALCSACDARLTVHKSPRSLVCHHCGQSRPLPTLCPDCSHQAMQFPGVGTERAEEAFADYFPDVPIVRIDSDSTRRKGRLEAGLALAQQAEPCILVGTQMLAKGHHFPQVSLSAIIDVDGALYSGDFRAIERLGQTIMQVGGRAGRADRQGEVALQTFHPDNSQLQRLILGRYDLFIKHLLAERQAAGMPPFSYLTAVRAEASSMAAAKDFLLELKQLALPVCPAEVTLLGPAPALMERKANRHRAQLLLVAGSRPRLQWLLGRLVPLWGKRKVSGIRWSIDVDPLEFL